MDLLEKERFKLMFVFVILPLHFYCFNEVRRDFEILGFAGLNTESNPGPPAFFHYTMRLLNVKLLRKKELL